MLDYERNNRFKNQSTYDNEIRPISYSYSSFVNSISLKITIEISMLLLVAITFQLLLSTYMDIDIATFNGQANNSTLNAAFNYISEKTMDETFDPTKELDLFVL